MSKETRKEFDEFRKDLHKVIDDMTEDSAMLLCTNCNSGTGEPIVAVRGSAERMTAFVAAAVGSIIEGMEISPMQTARYLEMLREAINHEAAEVSANMLKNMSAEKRNAALAEMAADLSSMIEDVITGEEDTDDADAE